jgi:phosphosulfolactate synthase (CoM biosynthesis protein A)
VIGPARALQHSSDGVSEGRRVVEDRVFPFLRINRRADKPRTVGRTEIRGPHYTPVGPRYLEDLFDTIGSAVDSFKFGGGSMALFPRPVLRGLIDLCHRHQVTVSTGGFIEYVLTQGPAAVDRYLGECRDLRFDTVEVSAGFVTLPADDFVRLTERVRKAGLNPKPEVGIQFGAGGATATEALEAEGTRDIGTAIRLVRRHLDAGADLVMIESEGITENVRAWRTDAVTALVDAVGPERLMFEAADPAVFTWYVKTYGPEVNLFVDHSQIVQLECLRAGIWGTNDVWGRVVTFKP